MKKQLFSRGNIPGREKIVPGLEKIIPGLIKKIAGGFFLSRSAKKNTWPGFFYPGSDIFFPGLKIILQGQRKIIPGAKNKFRA
jgi:hypothetical protein